MTTGKNVQCRLNGLTHISVVKITWASAQSAMVWCGCQPAMMSPHTAHPETAGTCRVPRFLREFRVLTYLLGRGRLWPDRENGAVPAGQHDGALRRHTGIASGSALASRHSPAACLTSGSSGRARRCPLRYRPRARADRPSRPRAHEGPSPTAACSASASSPQLAWSFAVPCSRATSMP